MGAVWKFGISSDDWVIYDPKFKKALFVLVPACFICDIFNTTVFTFRPVPKGRKMVNYNDLDAPDEYDVLGL